MPRKGYKFAVRWIAVNDEPLCTDPQEVAGYISTLLVADIFGKDPEDVAADVIRVRGRDLDEWYSSIVWSSK